MALTRRFAFLFIVIALMPLWTSAQEDNQALREAIRADITADARAAGMSEMEIETMVDALAAEAEEQGTAEEYLESKNNTFEQPEAPVYEEPLVNQDSLAFGGLALLVVLAGVAYFLIRNRKRKLGEPSVS